MYLVFVRYRYLIRYRNYVVTLSSTPDSLESVSGFECGMSHQWCGGGAGTFWSELEPA